MAASRPVGRSLYNLSNVFRSTYSGNTSQCNALLRNFGYRRNMVGPQSIFQLFQQLQFSTACSYNQQAAHASTAPNQCTPLHSSMQTTTHSTPATLPAPVRINRRTELDFQELKELQSANIISLIDVRHPQEIEKHGEIPGSVNIPLCKVKVALQLSAEEWTREFCMEKPCKLDRNLIFYARGPNASSAAVEIAHKLGFKKSRHYIGGWEDYCRQTGQPIKNANHENCGPSCNVRDSFDQYFL